MRVLRVLPFIVLFSIPLFAQQTAQRDAQAVTVVETALKAMGGATQIGQTQSWTIRATMQGPSAVGNITYTIDTQASKSTFTTKRGAKRTLMTRSFFLPAVLPALLVKQYQDTTYSLQYSAETLNSKSLNAVTFSTNSRGADQIWHFDPGTSLPVRVEFRLPATLGSRISQQGVTELSDFRSAGGLLYPFRIVTYPRGPVPEVITIQSVTPSATLPSTLSGPNSLAGDTL